MNNPKTMLKFKKLEMLRRKSLEYLKINYFEKLIILNGISFEILL